MAPPAGEMEGYKPAFICLVYFLKHRAGDNIHLNPTSNSACQTGLYFRIYTFTDTLHTSTNSSQKAPHERHHHICDTQESGDKLPIHSFSIKDIQVTATMIASHIQNLKQDCSN